MKKEGKEEQLYVISAGNKQGEKENTESHKQVKSVGASLATQHRRYSDTTELTGGLFNCPADRFTGWMSDLAAPAAGQAGFSVSVPCLCSSGTSVVPSHKGQLSTPTHNEQPETALKREREREASTERDRNTVSEKKTHAKDMPMKRKTAQVFDTDRGREREK